MGGVQLLSVIYGSHEFDFYICESNSHKPCGRPYKFFNFRKFLFHLFSFSFPSTNLNIQGEANYRYTGYNSFFIFIVDLCFNYLIFM